MLETQLHVDLGDAPFRAAWTQLVAADPDATVFHTPRYLGAWYRELGGRERLRVRSFHRDGELIAVLPLVTETAGSPTGPRAILSFLGGEDVTDYLGPIARPADREVVAAAWFRQLSEDREWDELIAAGLPEDTEWPNLIAANAEQAGFSITERLTDDVCPRVELDGGYDAYLERLPSKQRHELRRKARKLARDLGSVSVVAVAESDLAAAVARFLELAADTDGDKAGFFVDDRTQRWFLALADEYRGTDTFRLHELRIADQVIASTVSLVEGTEWGLYNSAFDRKVRHLGPGMVLVAELLRVAADEGLAVFDLLRGDEAYKYRFGAEDRVLSRVHVARTP